MADKDNEISTPSNFGAFIPIEDASDSESVDEEEEVEDEHIDDESFQGDCNDGEEFGNQVDLFEVHFGISSGNSGKFEDLNESDLLPEDFFKTSYHKAIEYISEDGSSPTSKRQKLS